MRNAHRLPSGTITAGRPTSKFAKISSAILVMLNLTSALASGQTSVLTNHNDAGHTGANLSETILTTSNVNVSRFGKLFSRTVDGQVYAQPLYVSGLDLGANGIHNVVYVATEKNNVYAFDADKAAASTPLWQVNLGAPVPVGETGETVDITEFIGITGTPVIDIVTRTLYCVAKTKEGTSYVQRLHALDLATGAETRGGPVVISGSVSGTGDDSVGGTIAFNSRRHLNRPGLLLLNGVVYIAFGSHGDNRPFHGWVFGYDAATLQRTAIFNTTPTGWGGAIWQSGEGLAADDAGNLYFETGNGSFNMNTGGKDCSSCFIKLSTPGLNLVDWFAPHDQSTLNAADFEIGIAGPIVLPGTNLVQGGSKGGLEYLLNRGNLGHFQAGSDSQIVQTLQVETGAPLHGAPVFWQSSDRGALVYRWLGFDTLKAFHLVNGHYQGTDPTSGLALPDSNNTTVSLRQGGSLSLSASASTAGTGVLWAINQVSKGSGGILRAFNASNVALELWNSQTNLARDDLGGFAKFVPPTIANGKVYVATSLPNQLLAYGLLDTPAPAVTSVVPGTGSIIGGTPITISGSNFVTWATVRVGGVVATGATVTTGSTIVATAPPHAAGVVNVTVTNPDGQSGAIANAFVYVPPPPVVNGVAPGSGSIFGGTGVTITGANFVAGASVTLSGNAATGVSATSSTAISATTTAHVAGPVDVTVTNPDGQSGTFSGGFTYVEPTVTLDSTSARSTAVVTATIANGPGGTGDWVGLFPVRAANTGYVAWQYLSGLHAKLGTGLANAVVAFTMPLTSGAYEVRLFRNDSFSLVATSGSVTVTAPAVTLDTSSAVSGAVVTATIANGPGTPGDWVGLFPVGAANQGYAAWWYLNGLHAKPATGLNNATVSFTLPQTAGVYEVRLFRNDSLEFLAKSGSTTVTAPTVTLDTTSAKSGAIVTATIANGPGMTGDWVGLFPAGAANTGYVAWQYLNGQHTKPAAGLANAAVPFTLPLTSGAYEVRLFRNDSLSLVVRSGTTMVTAPTVTLDATDAGSGAIVTARIANGPGTPGDWVGLFPVGATNQGYVAWQYLNGLHAKPGTGVSDAAVTFMMPLAPGAYQVRLFRNDSLSLLATSGTVTEP